MKKIFTLIVLLVSLSGYAQSVFKPALSHKEDYCTKDDIVAYSKFINNFNSKDLRFVRIQNNVSSKWTSAFCDCNFCYGVDTDSADFELAKGDSCITSAHFYPDLTKGSGYVKIKVFDKNNPSVFVIGEFTASCWGLSATFLNKEHLVVSPNPSTTSVNIKFGSAGFYVIHLLSSDGRILTQEKVEGLNHTMDISGMAAGLYSVKVKSSGKIFYSKFIKI